MTMIIMVESTDPTDVRDQRWLDGQIWDARHGIEAILEIAHDWTDGRKVGRLHPGVSAAEYIREHLGPTLLGRDAVVALLAESNWSNRQIAAVAGVSDMTVGRIAKATASDVAVERPAETLGADGKLRPARILRTVVAEVIEPDDDTDRPAGGDRWAQLTATMDAIRALAIGRTGYIDPTAREFAADVPVRRRRTTAKALRGLGSDLARIAMALEHLAE
jgi:hypothetical protein